MIPLPALRAAPATVPTLLSVLRRAHLGMALGGVAVVGLSLILPAAVALHVDAEHDLNLAARALRYTTEAAVVFRDREAASEALLSIASVADVAEASVADRNGNVLARWHSNADTVFARLSAAVAALLLDSSTSVPVLHEGEIVGKIQLRGSGRTLFGFLLAGAAGIVTCQILLVLGALYLSRRILGRIAKPLETLAEIAHGVRLQRRSGHRMPAAGIAELNEVSETFNALLDELDDWQASAQRENARLAHRASHDSLTGLPNRAAFEEQLSRALTGADHSGASVAVLFMDSDGFKQINDELGHAAGDAVLVSIAARVKAQLRDGDLVVRLGGDEFAVLLPSVKALSDVQQVAETISLQVRKPLVLSSGEEIATSLSIGIAMYPQDAANAASLLHSADAAMYRAKRNRRGGWESATAQQSVAKMFMPQGE